MRIGSNNLGLEFSRRLAETGRLIQRSLSRLSTGDRTAPPFGDTTAYALSVRLSSQIRGFVQANQNINQAKALVQTAENGLDGQIDIVRRMRELAIQGANSSLSLSDRENLDEQLVALLQEYRSISFDTQFNGMSLLDGSVRDFSIQLGANRTDELLLNLPNTQADQIFRKDIASGITEQLHSYGYTVGGEVEVADLNGDGNLDVATSSRLTSNLYIFFGRGDGSLESPVTYAVGGFPVGISVGDLNEDGHLDIVVNNRFSSDLSVYLNDGTGSFTHGQTLSVSMLSSSDHVHLEDLNNDGYLDVAVTALSGGLGVALGNGDGTFGSIQTFNLGGSGRGFSFDDFNGDGNLDVVVTNPIDASISYALGLGDGTFATRSVLFSGSLPQDVVTGDIDGDGDTDFVANFAGSNYIRVFLNNGSGIFTAGSTYATSGTERRVRLADFDRDGDLDIVTNATNGTVELFLNNAKGVFTHAGSYAAGTDSEGFEIGDLNGDGIPELIHSNTTLDIQSFVKKEVVAQVDLRLTTQTKSEIALYVLDRALEALEAERSKLSATHSRLDFSSNYNLLMSNSLEEARARAQDVNLAEELSELVRLQILEQAQVAVMAQSNLQAQMVLKLLDSLKNS